MLKLLRELIHYLIVLVAFAIATIFLPFLIIKICIEMYKLNDVKLKWIAIDVESYYRDIDHAIGWFI